MSGDLVINLGRLLPARRAIARLSQLRLGKLLDVLGSEVESQTRRRVQDEKTDPEGEPWKEWSEDYAARRPNKGGLLELGGDLSDSITYEVAGDVVYVGSNLVYAARHQEGDEEPGIPQRQYLGISADNLEDLGELTLEFLAREARS